VSSEGVPGGVVHELPADLRKALVANPVALAAWNDITPLARNEFICWVEDAKQQMTRERRIRRTKEELEEGKRRPCCWPGRAGRTRVPRFGHGLTLCRNSSVPARAPSRLVPPSANYSPRRTHEQCGLTTAATVLFGVSILEKTFELFETTLADVGSRVGEDFDAHGEPQGNRERSQAS